MSRTPWRGTTRRFAGVIALALVLPILPIGMQAASARNGDLALQLNGTSQYVTFGAAPSLGTTTMTLELWFKRTAEGVATGTGSGGLTAAVPLLTKGRSENDTPANVNANYFLGINTNGTAGNLTDDRLAVDFEDTATGLNHPFTATTVVGVSSVWHHAAATYDGSVWRVYLDGVLDGTSTPQAATPESGSIQHASLGTAMNSTGVAAGFFAGQLDEARIWSTARSGAQIASSMNTEITTPAPDCSDDGD